MRVFVCLSVSTITNDNSPKTNRLNLGGNWILFCLTLQRKLNALIANCISFMHDIAWT